LPKITQSFSQYRFTIILLLLLLFNNNNNNAKNVTKTASSKIRGVYFQSGIGLYENVFTHTVRSSEISKYKKGGGAELEDPRRMTLQWAKCEEWIYFSKRESTTWG
jgi:hypothetical protein